MIFSHSGNSFTLASIIPLRCGMSIAANLTVRHFVVNQCGKCIEEGDCMRIYEYMSRNETCCCSRLKITDLPAIENGNSRSSGWRLHSRSGLIAVKVERWNDDLSPWCAPAVFGQRTSETVLRRHCSAKSCRRGRRQTIHHRRILNGRAVCPGGSAYRTDRFSGIAAASPSLWFPEF